MSGNALPVKVLHDDLRHDTAVDMVNLSRVVPGSGTFSLRRAAQIASVLTRVRKVHGSADVVYLTIAESLVGNLRDLGVYAICRHRLRSVVIHMLGGAGMKQLLAARGVRASWNRWFLRQVGGIIVEGQTQRAMFAQVAGSVPIHVVPNFAEDDLFAADAAVERKFAEAGPLRVLFLSNLLPGKGHRELIEAYSSLEAHERAAIRIDVAGALVSAEDRALLDLIAADPQVTYHGPVGADAKRALYAQAHVFCLPTYYAYEGQPFCIIEAYAGGCAVITTTHSGIGDLFARDVNGYEVEPRSVASLAAALRRALANRGALAAFGRHNLDAARANHTRERFLASMRSALMPAAS